MKNLSTKQIANFYKEFIERDTIKADIYSSSRKIVDGLDVENLHPMLVKARDLAWEIIEVPDLEPIHQSKWQELSSLFKKYLNFDWDDTSWVLAVSYAHSSAIKKIHDSNSYSAIVFRRNGETKINSKNVIISDAIKDVLIKINKNQTDENFLKNLAELIPTKIDALSILDLSISVELMR